MVQGDEQEGAVVKRLNVLEMMKEFRSNQDLSDNDESNDRTDDSTEHELHDTADGNSASPDDKSPVRPTSAVRVCRLFSVRPLPTKFSQLPNLHICITSSQFSLLAAFALHLCNGHTRSSIYIIFSTNNISFLPLCFPSSLESSPGFPPSTTH